MALSSHRWHTIAESQFPWERDALDYLRERLPDQEPFRAWSNFEFIAEDGSIYEVDLVVLTAAGFLLIEIKSHPGTVEGDVHTWIWKDGGRELVTDNPIILANQKARKLASLLKRQAALNRTRAPFLEAVVFCSAPGIRIKLAGPAALNVYERDRGTEAATAQGIISRLTAAPDTTRGGRVDGSTAKAIARAMEQAGIRPSNRSRRVGDYELGSLLFQGPAYQDYEGSHVALKGVKRRVRLYPIPLGASPSDRETIRRAAQREFQILEGIHHPGLLRALEYKDHERGAALIFEHDPDAVRLDHFVQQHGPRLGVEQRLTLLRQIAETVQYAHEKRLVHRALSPQSILISSPTSLLPRTQILNWQSGYREATVSISSTPRQVTGTAHLEALVEDAATVYMAPEAASADGAAGEHVDVFSLGAIAYFLFSSQPPGASSLEVSEKLRESKGLRLSSAIDGASRELEELIQFSTHPEVSSRLDSAKDFTDWLTRVEAELTIPEEDVVQNPGDAKTGDRLRHGFTVKARLGQGSTAVALLVERDGATAVLAWCSGSFWRDATGASGERCIMRFLTPA